MSQFAPRKILTKPIKEVEAAPDPNAYVGGGMLANDLAKLEQDTKIMGKVNAVHREAFTQKYPGLIEHCLRLSVERLQAGLDKRGLVDIADTSTWRMSTTEIRDLAATIEHLQNVKNTI
jgi:hypothetical protein